jgi:hypothetical protein
MRVRIHHLTRDRYAAPAALGPHVVRLRPADHGRTRTLSYALEITPTPELRWQRDPWNKSPSTRACRSSPAPRCRRGSSIACSLGACTYHVWHPHGRAFEAPPLTAVEAAARRAQRFTTTGHAPSPCVLREVAPHPEQPFTLDLRRATR